MELSLKKQLEKQPNAWISKALTVLFIVIVIDQIKSSQNHLAAKMSFIVSIVSLLIFCNRIFNWNYWGFNV